MFPEVIKPERLRPAGWAVKTDCSRIIPMIDRTLFLPGATNLPGVAQPLQHPRGRLVPLPPIIPSRRSTHPSIQVNHRLQGTIPVLHCLYPPFQALLQHTANHLRIRAAPRHGGQARRMDTAVMPRPRLLTSIHQHLIVAYICISNSNPNICLFSQYLHTQFHIFPPLHPQVMAQVHLVSDPAIKSRDMRRCLNIHRLILYSL